MYRFRKLKTIALIMALTAASGSVMAAINEAPPSPVKVEQVQQSTIVPTATVMGTIYSRNQTQLTAGVNGKLEWVAEPGTYLKQGDLIAQVELLPLQLTMAQRKAQLKRAKINLNYLKKELNRQNELRKQNNTSQFQLEQTQSQVELAESDLEIAGLQLRQSNDELDRATIKAPFESVVTARMLRAGFDVTRSDVLVTLLDTQNLEARAFIPVKYLAFTKPGSTVKLLSFDDDQDMSFEAVANIIIPAADPLSQTFEMRITIPAKATEFWAAGQLVRVKIPVESERSALTVHRDALILRRGNLRY